MSVNNAMMDSKIDKGINSLIAQISGVCGGIMQKHHH